MDGDTLKRIEDGVNRLARYQRCLHAWLTAGPHADRAVIRAELDAAAAALDPPPKAPVVSDPDAGPPVPMT